VAGTPSESSTSETLAQFTPDFINQPPSPNDVEGITADCFGQHQCQFLLTASSC
jgi:hypothetical protein